VGELQREGAADARGGADDEDGSVTLGGHEVPRELFLPLISTPQSSAASYFPLQIPL